MRTKIIAASVVCAAALVGLAARYGGSSPPPAAAAQGEKTKAPSDPQSTLEDRIAALERGRTSACSGVAPTAAPTATARAEDDKGGDGQDQKPAPKSREEWKRDVVAGYSTFHAGERVDPSWSGGAARSVADTFRKASLEGSSLASTDCRSTMCKLEIEHESPSAQLYFMQHIPADPPFDTAGFYHRVEAEDGSFRTVLYVARDGYPLPAPAM